MTAPTAQATTDDRARIDLEEATRALLADFDPSTCTAIDFLGAQFDRGLAWVDFPPGLGGRGYDPRDQGVVDGILRAAGAPSPVAESPIGYRIAGPLIVDFGTDEMKSQLLRPVFTGEQLCCQLFSEPGAGSDLAALSSRATLDGDGSWRISGQKVWTTIAHRAKWGLLIARSSAGPDARRSSTFFLLDMETPGIEIRPIRQLTGDCEYNEVFLDEVVVPDEHRLGPVDGGWTVTLAALANERRAIGAGQVAAGGRAIDHALALWRSADTSADRVVLRDRLTRCWVESRVQQWLEMRGREIEASGGTHPFGPLTKLLNSKVNQTVAGLMVEALGPEGMLYPAGYEDEFGGSYRNHFENPQQYFLRSRSHSIGGGTSEIVRNQIGERLLGLPREPRGGADR